jgi:membrane associated rhomboid family serine protease
MFSDNLNSSPVNPVPPAALILPAILIAVEVALQAGARGLVGGADAVGWRSWLIQNYSFFDPVFEHIRQNRDFSPEYLMRFITYPVVHFSLHQALFAAVMMLALGKKVAEDFSSWSIFVIAPVATVGGALAYGLLTDSRVPLVGGFPAVYGLLGAYTWQLWLALDGKGRARWTAFRLVGFLMVLQLVWSFGFGAPNDWIAFAAAFAAGFGLSFLLAPDAGPRLRRWLEAVRG